MREEPHLIRAILYYSLLKYLLESLPLLPRPHPGAWTYWAFAQKYLPSNPGPLSAESDLRPELHRITQKVSGQHLSALSDKAHACVRGSVLPMPQIQAESIAADKSLLHGLP